MATHDGDRGGMASVCQRLNEDPRRPKLAVMYVLSFDDSEPGLWWRGHRVGIELIGGRTVSDFWLCETISVGSGATVKEIDFLLL